MNTSVLLRGAIVFTILLVLHYAIRPMFGWHASIDFLLIAVLLGAVRVRPGTAAIAGFLLGIMADSLSLTGFGSGALALTVVAFAASWLRAVFFADNLMLHGVFFFFGKWLEDILLVVSTRGVRGGGLAQQLLLWSPLSGLVTATAGVLLLVLLRPLMEPSRV